MKTTSESPPSRPGTGAGRALRWLARFHTFGSLFIVLVATVVISDQVGERGDFASSTVAQDVESRWGAPVVQPSPSLRYVQSGSIFTELRPLAFDRQEVAVDASMNYRKRGLRYFSGFDFGLTADYTVHNPESNDIDVAFVFPIVVDKSQVLLSELQFQVDGVNAQLDLGETGDRLMWTGRIPKGGQARFAIRYRARGLDSFIYKMDPSLPANGVHLRVSVKGGDNFDYPPNVLSASSANSTRDQVALDWAYPSLESGVNLGVVLPSEKTFDVMIATMARRAWVPFLGLLAALSALGVKHRRELAFYEAYLLAAAFGFSFVLVAYLAAFTNFYLAYGLVLVGLGAAVVAYARSIFPDERIGLLCGLWLASMGIPTAAVVLETYTGLIYTLEILALLLGLMVLSTRTEVRAFLAHLFEIAPGSQEPTSVAPPLSPLSPSPSPSNGGTLS